MLNYESLTDEDLERMANSIIENTAAGLEEDKMFALRCVQFVLELPLEKTPIEEGIVLAEEIHGYLEGE